MLKASFIYLVVWMIARSVTEEDLEEYRKDKAHRERYIKYVRPDKLPKGGSGGSFSRRRKSKDD